MAGSLQRVTSEFAKYIKSRRMRGVGHVARMVVHKILVGKSEWKRPLGRTSRR
jgi:hypothetical protein